MTADPRQLPVTVNGMTFRPEEIEKLPEAVEHGLPLFRFLKEWYGNTDGISVKTSGSTGTPKEMTITREAMLASAAMTCRYFNLIPGNTALLCLPMDYIAGKMMAARALLGELNLIVRPPSSHPLADVDQQIDFAAMVPLQVRESLREPEEKARLESIGRLIIGGSPVDEPLEREIRRLPHPVYSTYGMTETLSHIAVRRLNGPDASSWYTALEGVRAKLSPEGTLIVDVPGVTPFPVTTHDLAEVRGNKFRILGRKGNVINSGGIKIHPEELERKISPFLSGHFAITSTPDERLGEAVILLTECPVDNTTCEAIKNALSRHEFPRRFIVINSLPVTENGKTDRPACRAVAASHI